KDCFTAACKRLTEELRVLAETIHTIDPPAAEMIEQLRYKAYTLEKDIVTFSGTCEKYRSVRLYIVITSNLPAEVLSLAKDCAAGGADCIQLRAKNIADDQLFAMSKKFVEICKEHNVISVINDRIDIAVLADADGVHLGQNDLPIAQVRKLQTRPLITGKSTHSIEQFEQACLERPTYVALGPVFATDTKPDAPPVGLKYVKAAAEKLAGTGIGNVAIGGITVENVETVLAAGAASIAVCSAVTHAKDPKAACTALKAKIADFFKD
ncbi:MAG: thiamine phosphate synthase, partial [Planctomycetota bacterium]